MGTHMKKTFFKKELKKWLKHWYLGGGGIISPDNSLINAEEKKLERKYYKALQCLIDQSVSDDASGLS